MESCRIGKDGKEGCGLVRVSSGWSEFSRRIFLIVDCGIRWIVFVDCCVCVCCCERSFEIAHCAIGFEY